MFVVDFAIVEKARTLPTAPRERGTEMKQRKMYQLNQKKHGVGGVTFTNPKPRKQDRRAISSEGYAVIFFPKVYGIGKADVDMFGLDRSLSSSPEAARVKFLDGLAKGERWSSYEKAGHRVRKVRIMDMGDA